MHQHEAQPIGLPVCAAPVAFKQLSCLCSMCCIFLVLFLPLSAVVLAK
jgi:hypothetical protein